MPLMLSTCGGDTSLRFLDPKGPVADAQRLHFYWVLWIVAILVAGPVFVLLPFFVWRYRYCNTIRYQLCSAEGVELAIPTHFSLTLASFDTGKPVLPRATSGSLSPTARRKVSHNNE